MYFLLFFLRGLSLGLWGEPRHVAKQVSAGWRGLWGAVGLAWVLLRVGSEALVRGLALVAQDAFRGRATNHRTGGAGGAPVEGGGDATAEGAPAASAHPC